MIKNMATIKPESGEQNGVAVRSSAWLASKYPNNKPKLVTEKQLFERGMAIECRGPSSLFGYTPIVCVNIFGIRETHLLANDEALPQAGRKETL